MAGQLLARTAAGVQFLQSSQADLYAIGAGLIQYFLLLWVWALRTPSTSFPLPFLLGVVIGLGNAAAVVFLPLVVEEIDEGIFSSMLMSAVCFVFVGGIAQLSWGLHTSFQNTEALRLLREYTKGFSQASERDDGGPVVFSHYEETMKQVDAVEQALRLQPTLSEEVLDELGVIFLALKGTLTSGKLYKTEVRGGRKASTSPLFSSVSGEAKQLRQVQQLLESECEKVEEIKPRHSQHSQQSEEAEADELPHCMPEVWPQKEIWHERPLQLLHLTGSQLDLLAQHAPVHHWWSTSSSISWHNSIEVALMTHQPSRVKTCCMRWWTRERLEELSETRLMWPLCLHQAANLGRWKFDAYELERQHGYALLHAGFRIGTELLDEAGVTNFNLPLRGFLQEVQKQYHNVPYHNHVHAADVLSSCAYFLREDRKQS
eukprot:g12938.t1